MTVEVVDPTTGEARTAQIFVAALGASNYTYAEATWTQTLPDWIASHVRMLEYFGGVTALIIPDNLKSGVTYASYYEPEINATYAEFAAHYRTAILPTRVVRPRDKAKVETAVQIVERELLAPLRHHRFTSLAELNLAIRERLERLNTRPFKSSRARGAHSSTTRIVPHSGRSRRSGTSTRSGGAPRSTSITVSTFAVLPMGVTPLSSTKSVRSGVSLGVSFSLQSTTSF